MLSYFKFLDMAKAESTSDSAMTDFLVAFGLTGCFLLLGIGILILLLMDIDEFLFNKKHVLLKSHAMKCFLPMGSRIVFCNLCGYMYISCLALKTIVIVIIIALKLTKTFS